MAFVNFQFTIRIDWSDIKRMVSRCNCNGEIVYRILLVTANRRIERVCVEGGNISSNGYFECACFFFSFLNVD